MLIIDISCTMLVMVIVVIVAVAVWKVVGCDFCTGYFASLLLVVS